VLDVRQILYFCSVAGESGSASFHLGSPHSVLKVKMFTISPYFWTTESPYFWLHRVGSPVV